MLKTITIVVQDWGGTYSYSGQSDVLPHTYPCMLIADTMFEVVAAYRVDEDALEISLQQLIRRDFATNPPQHKGVAQEVMQEALVKAFQLTSIVLTREDPDV